MNLGRYRAVFGIDMQKFIAVVDRATAMYSGMAADTTTYAAPNPSLSTFKGLITNATTSQGAVKLRTVGGGRDARRGPPAPDRGHGERAPVRPSVG